MRAVAIESLVAFATAASTDVLSGLSLQLAKDLLTVFVVDVVCELFTKFLASGLDGGLEALKF